VERPDDHKTELRLWLRMLTCTTLIENEVRRRLREAFDITLPRFDVLAQLDRSPEGMTLGELSQRMMVSNGNMTGLVDRLVEQGLLRRRPSPTDRRAQIVSLTPDIEGYLRASEYSRDRIEDLRTHLKEGDTVQAMITNVDRKNRSINLSVKAKDIAEESDAMKQLRSEQAASAAGSTNLGALLRAKLDNRNPEQ